MLTRVKLFKSLCTLWLLLQLWNNEKNQWAHVKKANSWNTFTSNVKIELIGVINQLLMVSSDTEENKLLVCLKLSSLFFFLLWLCRSCMLRGLLCNVTIIYQCKTLRMWCSLKTMNAKADWHGMLGLECVLFLLQLINLWFLSDRLEHSLSNVNEGIILSKRSIQHRHVSLGHIICQRHVRHPKGMCHCWTHLSWHNSSFIMPKF